MRNRYIVAYDVSNAKRLRRMFKKMNGFGEPLQYSVFSCDLSRKERVLLEEALMEIINVKEDRVLIVDTGPSEGRAGGALKTLGRQIVPEARDVTVV